MATYVGNALHAHAKQGCYLCVRGDGLVDLGVDIVGEGALVLCKGCIAEAAEAAELTFNRSRIRELEARVLEQQNEITLAQARQAAFDAAIQAAADVHASGGQLTPMPLPQGLKPAPPVEPNTLPDAIQCGAPTVAGNPCRQTLRSGVCPSHGAPQKVVR